MLRIGIDFDNTIACYDDVFVSIARRLGISLRNNSVNKFEVRREIQSRADGGVVWQRLQGQVYGKHMLLAHPFPGIHEFIFLARMRGHHVFVVSHKSKYGHFDADRVPLRDQAKLWLEKNDFFRYGKFSLQKQNIFFEATREEKIQRIRDLKCTHFIDDLLEIFDDRSFPSDINKYVFNPNKSEVNIPKALKFRSWRQITSNVLGCWSENEILLLARQHFPNLNLNNAELMAGRANSRVYKLTSFDSACYLLKFYPDRQLDSRPRLETDFKASSKLSELSYPVGSAIGFALDFGLGLYEWLDGEPIVNCDDSFIHESIKFVERLYSDSNHASVFVQFGLASQACLSGVEIAKQVELRIDNLLCLGDPTLTSFIRNQFIPIFHLALNAAMSSRDILFNEPLDQRYQIASPSDFGAHNAMRLPSGLVMFYDFEYFGWDDPVKLVSDFYWHPGMQLNANTREVWLERTSSIFVADSDYLARLTAYLPLFGLRWCLIILNEFLKSELPSAIDVNPQQMIAYDDMCSRQLNKAKALLQEIEEHLHHGSKVQTS
jgi:hypothetical protein